MQENHILLDQIIYTGRVKDVPMMLMMPNTNPLLLKKVRYDPSWFPPTGFDAALITRCWYTCSHQTMFIRFSATKHFASWKLTVVTSTCRSVDTR